MGGKVDVFVYHVAKLKWLMFLNDIIEDFEFCYKVECFPQGMIPFRCLSFIL